MHLLYCLLFRFVACVGLLVTVCGWLIVLFGFLVVVIVLFGLR